MKSARGLIWPAMVSGRGSWIERPSRHLGLTPDPAVPGLTRSLSLTHAVLYGLGVTIGAGIYVLVGVAAGRAGIHAPLAFLLGALVMSFTAASFAELGTRMPVSGSEAAYVEAAFKRRWISIATGLLVIATALISAATISVGSAGYLSVFVALPGPWLIAAVVVGMGLIACLATAQSITVAGIMTVIEIAGLVLIIGAGLIWHDGVFSRLPEVVPAVQDSAGWIGIMGTTLIAVFAYIGFEHLVNIAEELRDPTRTLPRALFLTLGVTALVYIAVVWIAVSAVSSAELAASPAPLALVFQRLTGLPLRVMSAIAVVATLNGIVVHLIMISRIAYGMARQGNMPQILARVEKRTRTPVIATALATVLVLILSLAVPLVGLADLASRGTLAIFVLVNLALIRLHRASKPAPTGIFVAPSWVPYAGLASSLLFLALDWIA